MANNESSGPSVTTFLAKWILEKERKYTYRIVFSPETIGAIVYISKNYDALRKNVIAGFNITCVGDNNNYSFLPSRMSNTLADKVARHVLDNFVDNYDEYSFLSKGSDERQYCHPKVDLPLVSVMRSKYGTFSEYHTSLDNLDFVSPAGLQGGFEVNKRCLEALELNDYYDNCIICEPKMIKRDLKPDKWHLRHFVDGEKMKKQVRDMMNVVFYCDGEHDLIDISNKVDINYETCHKCLKKLEKSGIIEK
jgi:aminopeptidase-like protein